MKHWELELQRRAYPRRVERSQQPLTYAMSHTLVVEWRRLPLFHSLRHRVSAGGS